MLIEYFCSSCGVYNEVEFDGAITCEECEDLEVQCEACKFVEMLVIRVGKDPYYYDEPIPKRSAK